MIIEFNGMKVECLDTEEGVRLALVALRIPLPASIDTAIPGASAPELIVKTQEPPFPLI